MKNAPVLFIHIFVWIDDVDRGWGIRVTIAKRIKFTFGNLHSAVKRSKDCDNKRLIGVTVYREYIQNIVYGEAHGNICKFFVAMLH